MLTFGPEVPVEGAVLGEAAAALVALEGFLAGVVADVAHQGALLPEPPAAELAHVGLVLQVGTEMHLLGVLQHREARQGLRKDTADSRTRGATQRLL